MSFLSSFKKLFRFGGDDNGKKGQWNRHIKKDIDPLTIWEIIGELGDGAFGVVFKVSDSDQWRNDGSRNLIRILPTKTTQLAVSLNAADD